MRKAKDLSARLRISTNTTWFENCFFSLAGLRAGNIASRTSGIVRRHPSNKLSSECRDNIQLLQLLKRNLGMRFEHRYVEMWIREGYDVMF
jgi:hypothetical protein